MNMGKKLLAKYREREKKKKKTHWGKFNTESFVMIYWLIKKKTKLNMESSVLIKD